MTAKGKSPGQVVERQGAEWERAKEEALKRDQYRCQHCRKTEARYGGCDLQVHHIKPVSKGGTHDLDNLVVLCNSCHWDLHGHFDERDRLPPGLLEDYDPATFRISDERPDLDGFRDSAIDVLEVLQTEGPTQLKNIIEETEWARGTVQRALETLKVGNYVCRVERGVYAYVTEIEYRRMLERGRDEHGNYTVHVWDPGEQVEITEFVDDSQEDNDA